MPETITSSPAARVIRTRMFDSTRWDHVPLRADDVIVATWAKAGTTLTQQIVTQLLLGGPEGVEGLDASPWVDVQFMAPLGQMAAMLEAQTRRRVMKTHLSFDAVPYNSSVKYLYIGRDARDVLWSAYNHARSFTPAAWDMINNVDAGAAPKWSRPDEDVRAYYLHWLDTDTAPGFHDLPFWPHVQGWWDVRDRPNVLLLHYANLIDDLAGEMRRIAAFLDIPIDEQAFPAMVEHCGIDYMREQSATRGFLSVGFENGAASFFNKGTNGRWRDVLTPAEIARCDAVAAAKLTPGCAHWLKTGDMISESRP